MFLSRIGTFMWDSLDWIILRSNTMLRLSDITGIMFSRFFGEQRATKECAEKITRSDPHPSLAGLSLPEKRQKITFIRLAVTLPALKCYWNKEFHIGGFLKIKFKILETSCRFSGGFPYKNPKGDGKKNEIRWCHAVNLFSGVSFQKLDTGGRLGMVSH